jgi:hypothetical protein
LAREVIAAPAPTDNDEKQNWKDHVAFAHDVEVYTEYALYATAVGAPPETTVDLLAALETPRVNTWPTPMAYTFTRCTRLARRLRSRP